MILNNAIKVVHLISCTLFHCITASYQLKQEIYSAIINVCRKGEGSPTNQVWVCADPNGGWGGQRTFVIYNSQSLSKAVFGLPTKQNRPK